MHVKTEPIYVLVHVLSKKAPIDSMEMFDMDLKARSVLLIKKTCAEIIFINLFTSKSPGKDS
jgi:hypothetical protein